MPILSAYFARKSLGRLELKEKIREHALRLLDLAGPDHRIQVSRIHEELFPLSTTASANSSLNRLLRELNTAARDQGISLGVEITPDKKAGAANRWVWFEGSEEAPALAYTGELNAIPPDQLITTQRGLPTTDLPVVVLITFNPHETAAVVAQFHPQGQPVFETRNGMTYNLLGAHGGLRIVQRVSKQGEGEAQNAAHDAIRDWQPRAIIGVGIAFGVNPAKQAIGDVLVSENIRGYELGRQNRDGTFTLRSDKPSASAVLYQRFNQLDQTCQADPDACLHWPTVRFGTLLSGNKLVDDLDYRSSLLAFEQEAIGGEMEAVGIQLAADRHKVDWIIVKAICDWGDGNKNSKRKERDQTLAATHAARVVQRALSLCGLYEGPSPDASSATDAAGSKRPIAPRLPRVHGMGLRDCEAIGSGLLIEDGQGQLTSLAKDGEPEPSDGAEQGVEVMDYLLNWVEVADAPPLFALLGEYGMGKTVTCQRLAQILDERRRDDPTRPVPLYFDLRHVTGLDRGVPKLREILEECMARGWNDAPQDGALLLEDVHRWISQGAVVIFDGLDEVLVKLREADGLVFTQELLRLYTITRDRRRADALETRLKLLISCRTQYFRTLRDQQNHFTGQERGEHRAAAYRALVLLPLSDAQVQRYLGAALPGAALERLLETIRSVHNLTELTQRPYTLRLVAEFIPEIEQDRLAGRTVHGVTLYRRMARRWLERDSGKHHIRPDHKLRLAAHLAAHLWRTGQGVLPADRIEAWFHAWLESEPELRRRYDRLHPDQLEEDLRTATFLARQDDPGGSSFRFAHTSLLEFFLADYLLQAVRDDVPERWAISRPSVETLDFLGQLLAEAAEPALLQTLSRWCRLYRRQTSELLSSYALRADQQGWPMPMLRGIDLAGADLDEWEFRGRETGDLLDLSEARLDGARLRRAVFERVRLSRASLRGAQLIQANFLGCDAQEADWSAADCTAAIWRETDLTGGVWDRVEGRHPWFLTCRSAPIADQSPPGFTGARIAPVGSTPAPSAVLTYDIGHVGPALSCAWSPDGRWLLSGGWDGTLRVWDGQSGEGRLTLRGHERGAVTCAWSPDGRWLLSGGMDGTLRVWDVQSGEERLTLRGHERGVSACAWSPDGRWLLSGGLDGTLRVWDGQSGEGRLTLRGHERGASACVWSPDGRWLLSGGWDGTLRVWDGQSGEGRLTLRGHEHGVVACAWSPDGRWLLSGGDDGTLRVWDGQSGEGRFTLHGHAGGVRACAWSPDGRWLLSGGLDGTLRVWDGQSGEGRLTLRGHAYWVVACAWSPDGRWLLSGGDDGTLRVWNGQSGEGRLTLRGHERGVNACAWSPDGRWALSGGWDGTLRVWDAQSGEWRLTLRGHAGWVHACAWSPDGRWLLSGGSDGTLRVWDAQSGELVRVHAVAGVGQRGHAVWDPREQRVIEAEGDAWRWLRWSVPGPDGRLESLPAETYGPLPAPRWLREVASP